MKLLAFDIPEDAAELPGWIERQLLGLDLGQIVAELSAVHSAEASNGLRLQSLLGDRQERVLQNGLRELPPESIRQLLRHPKLLFELQELVLVGGGPYWQRALEPSPQMKEQLARGLQGLERFVTREPFPEASSAIERRREPWIRSLQERIAWYFRPWAVALATAAVVLLGVYTYHVAFPPATPSSTSTAAAASWGWNKPDALPHDVAANVYLHKLADAAEEWSQKRPDDAIGLAKRLLEFRRGCSTLIFAEHRPLVARDRQWLIEKCRKWAGELDAEITALEGGEKPEEVRAKADDTVRKLVAALREKAKQVDSA